MTKQFRTLFLSDIHLGSRHCNAELLLQTLSKIKADTIYLLGDIVDLWELKKKSPLAKHPHSGTQPL